MKIIKAITVAKQLGLESSVPLEFKLRAAAEIVTLDRLRVIERMRDSPGSHIQLIADELEKEIRAAGFVTKGEVLRIVSETEAAADPKK